MLNRILLLATTIVTLSAPRAAMGLEAYPDTWNSPAVAGESATLAEYIAALARRLERLIWESLNDPVKFVKLGMQLAEWAKDLSKDTDMNPTDKAAELMRAIEKDSTPFKIAESTTTGQLGLELQYSPSFGAVTLTWNRVVIRNQCHVVPNISSIVTQTEYWDEEAEYLVYRNDKLLARIPGRLNRSLPPSTSIGYTTNLANSTAVNLSRIRGSAPYPQGRAAPFVDFDANVYSTQATYRVYAWAHGCISGPHVGGALVLPGPGPGPASRHANMSFSLDSSGRPDFWPVTDFTERRATGPWLGAQVATAQDASGKLTVSLFERTSEFESAHNRRFRVSVPSDYVVIGGGAEGGLFPYGNLLTASNPTDDLRSWEVSTKDHHYSHPVKVRAWAIGLKVAGLTREQLLAHISVVRSKSTTTDIPQATASLDSAFVLAGGGFRVNWSGAGQLATASYPSSSVAWTAKSKQHHFVSPAEIESFAIGIRRQLPGVGTLIPNIATRASAYTSHPTATVAMPSGFVRTGCGAQDNWSGAGNLLWKIEPNAVSNCIAHGKDHHYASPATLNAYALGFTLTPQ